MFCTECGNKIPDEARFCPICGHPNIVPENPGQAPDDALSSMPVGTVPPLDATQPMRTPPQSWQQPAAQDQQAQTMPARSGNRNPRTTRGILIGVIAALAAAVIVVAGIFLIPRLGGGGDITVQITDVTRPSISIGGKIVTALVRPTIVAALDEEQAANAAPALNGYRSEGAAGGAPAAAHEAANAYGTVASYQTDSSLGNVVNLEDYGREQIDYLGIADSLAENNFAVSWASPRDEFFEIYEDNRYVMLPNFVTVDSMVHTYHLYFAHLQKQTEKNQLAPKLTQLSKDMVARSQEQYAALSGTEWQQAAQRNVAFFAVAATLLDPAFEMPAEAGAGASAELGAVASASGVATSPLFECDVDYSQFAVRGYYEGDATLESYFRAMMWYGLMNFAQQSDALGDDLNRSALLATIALAGNTATPTADPNWESIYAITSFFAGASDDLGFYEYYPMIEAAYGEGFTLESLVGNDDAWRQFCEMAAAMPAPKINSVVIEDSGDSAGDVAEGAKGFRLMGQRFTLDSYIFTQLTYRNVDQTAAGEKRMMPSALDVPAVLGSDEAYGILESQGKTDYPNYDESVQELRAQIAANSSFWTGSLYAQWLYTLNPLIGKKGEGYPSFMTSDAWSRKDLLTYCGSYAELKHDTVLYSKQSMAELGGGEVTHDDRGYVEPEPEVYKRLAALSRATSEGLSRYDAIGSTDAEDLELLATLADKLAAISEKELADQSLSDDDYELIRSFGGQLEHFWDNAREDKTNNSYSKTKEFPAAIVADVASDPNGSCLELGTGRVNEIFVLVPIEGELHLTSGAVYSYYEFEWPLSDRLTDSKWRDMLGIKTYEPSPDLPESVEWTSGFDAGK